MKKLNLEKIKLDEKNILNRNQLKQIVGGYDDDTKICNCPDGSSHYMYCWDSPTCVQLCLAICKG